MRRIDAFMATLALAGLAVSLPGTAIAAGAAPAGGSNTGGSNAICRVQVIRTASSGVFDVVREVTRNNRCICRVTTGPRGQGGSAESALASLLLRRTCTDAPLAVAGTGGGIGTGLIIGGLVAVGGGLALALRGSSSP